MLEHQVDQRLGHGLPLQFSNDHRASLGIVEAVGIQRHRLLEVRSARLRRFPRVALGEAGAPQHLGVGGKRGAKFVQQAASFGAFPDREGGIHRFEGVRRRSGRGGDGKRRANLGVVGRRDLVVGSRAILVVAGPQRNDDGDEQHCGSRHDGAPRQWPQVWSRHRPRNVRRRPLGAERRDRGMHGRGRVSDPLRFFGDQARLSGSTHGNERRVGVGVAVLGFLGQQRVEDRGDRGR